MTDPILSVQDLCVDYLTESQPVRAVRNVTFQVARGEVFGLVGESGSGKSTVAHAVLRTLGPPAVISGGRILFEGTDILRLARDSMLQYRWRKISLVMQSALNALNPVLTIGAQTSEILRVHQGMSPDEARQRSESLMDLVGIERNRLSSYPHELSGGMRQRVVTAMALALVPPLIVMDEPTTALDVVVERDILLKVLELRRQLGFSILFITHDLNLLLEFADRVGVMRGGQLLETGTAEQIRAGGTDPYTRQLLGSLPSASGPRQADFLPPRAASLPPAGAPLLEIRGLTKEFQLGGWRRARRLLAVSDVTFAVGAGEIVALVGESGSGKSTVARIAARLLEPTAGEILLDGRSLDSLRGPARTLQYRKQVQMVFQDPFASLNPVHPVKRQIARVLLRHGMAEPGQVGPRVERLLDQVGLAPGSQFAAKFPHEMSGGERQRVAIARALAVEPRIIIADEPTSMLDVSLRRGILRLLAELRNERGLSILFITHDLASARYLADRIVVMQRGKKVEEGPSEELVHVPAQAYTRQLVAAASPGWLRGQMSSAALRAPR